MLNKSWGACRLNSFKELETVIVNYRDKAFNISRNITRNDTLAEDAVSDAILLAFKSINSFRKESALSSWFLRIVVNRTFDIMSVSHNSKVHYPIDSEILTSIPDYDFDIARIINSYNSYEKARELVSKIENDVRRTAVHLRIFEEYTSPEIARELGISEAHAKSTLYRGLCFIREELIKFAESNEI